MGSQKSCTWAWGDHELHISGITVQLVLEGEPTWTSQWDLYSEKYNLRKKDVTYEIK